MYSPRIYTYKITFEEVPYYYYGMHEEKVCDEEYWGSPSTHKWCWKFYTPKKQILEVFNTRKEACDVEKRLIKPFYKTDPNCLNECCGGIYSLETCSKAGKIGGSISGKRHKENKTGIFAYTPEEKSEICRMGGNHHVKTGHIQRLGKNTAKMHMENKTGIFAMTPEEKSERSKKSGQKHKENGTGIFAMTAEQREIASKKADEVNRKNKTGIYSITPEERVENSRKGGLKNKELGLGIFAETKEERSKRATQTNYQKWMCTETGFITNAGNLSKYQRVRGIDTSMRIKLE
jgi:hypothetical protein